MAKEEVTPPVSDFEKAYIASQAKKAEIGEFMMMKLHINRTQDEYESVRKALDPIFKRAHLFDKYSNVINEIQKLED